VLPYLNPAEVKFISPHQKIGNLKIVFVNEGARIAYSGHRQMLDELDQNIYWKSMILFCFNLKGFFWHISSIIFFGDLQCSELNNAASTTSS